MRTVFLQFQNPLKQFIQLISYKKASSFKQLETLVENLYTILFSLQGVLRAFVHFHKNPYKTSVN